jgi:stress response protein SCP2
MELVAGANTIIPTSRISIEIQIFGIDSSELDFSAYSLATNAKVCSDDDMIFYGQLHNKSQTIKLTQTSSSVCFQINLPEVSPKINKISICATLANEQQDFSSVNYLNIKIKNSNIIATSKITGQNRSEVALIIGEFYRYQQSWKFRLISQGFNGGLKSLAEHFGVNIADEQPHTEVSPPPIPSQATSDTTSNISNTLKDIFLSPLKLIEKHKRQKEFQSKLSQYLSDGKLTNLERQQLDEFCIEHELDKQQLFKQSSLLINNFLHFTLANIIADRFVGKDE